MTFSLQLQYSLAQLCVILWHSNTFCGKNIIFLVFFQLLADLTDYRHVDEDWMLITNVLFQGISLALTFTTGKSL